MRAGPWERDSAYHQGTVWGWLWRAGVDRSVHHRPLPLATPHGVRQRARTLLDGFAVHLHEAGLGTVSEIFDADALDAEPPGPRGCIAQAWSVPSCCGLGWRMCGNYLVTPLELLGDEDDA